MTLSSPLTLFIFMKCFSRLVGFGGPTTGKSSGQVPPTNICISDDYTVVMKEKSKFSSVILTMLFQDVEPPLLLCSCILNLWNLVAEFNFSLLVKQEEPPCEDLLETHCFEKKS